MEISLIAIGKIKDQSIKCLCDDYLSRIKRYRHEVNIIEVRDARGRLSPAEIMIDETARLLEKTSSADRLIILDRQGRELGSRQFARMIQAFEESAQRKIAFLLGGAFGLDFARINAEYTSVSLSKMTLTHEHARLILLEQLYRANTIVRGEPYHK